MPITGDLSQWPVVYSRFDGEQTLEELEPYIDRMDEVHRRRQPWVNISFMKTHTRDAAVLRRVARWMRDTRDTTARYCMGVGLISPSNGFRFLLSSVFLITPLPCPHDVFGNFDHAFAYVHELAARRGITLPAVQPPWPDVPRTAQAAKAG